MPPTINMPARTLERVKAMGGALFTEAEVIERLIDEHDRRMFATPEGSSSGPAGEESRPSPRTSRAGNVQDRRPRERGVTVEIMGQRVVADTVRDLYERTLRFLVDGGHMERLRPFVPYRTSPRRNLIADEPVHPNGNSFVVPVSYSGLYMESHKDYRTALKQLRTFLSKAGIGLDYLG